MVTWKKKADGTDDTTVEDKADSKWATKVDDGTHANMQADDKAASKTSYEVNGAPPAEATDVLPPVLQGRSAAALGQNIPVEEYQGNNHAETWTCASCGKPVNGLHCPLDGDTQHGNGNGRAPGPSRGPTLPALPSTPATPNAVVDGAGGSLDAALRANPPGPVKSSIAGVTPSGKGA